MASQVALKHHMYQYGQVLRFNFAQNSTSQKSGSKSDGVMGKYSQNWRLDKSKLDSFFFAGKGPLKYALRTDLRT